jgi:hypothetical protein
MDICLNNRLFSSFRLVSLSKRHSVMEEDARESKRMMREMGLTLAHIRETTTPQNSPRAEQILTDSITQCREMLTRLDDFSLDEDEEDERIIIEECFCVCF